MTLIDLDRRHVWHPFTQEATAPLPILIERGQGASLFDDQGREYLDLIASWWVNLHGHGHPGIAQALADQAARLEQVIFAGFTHEPAIRLSAELTRLLPGLTRVFFSDNGSTAVEVAIKMAIQYGRNQGQTRPRLAVFQGGYHGDTVGAMSMGRSTGFFNAFAPLLFQVDALPFPETWWGDGAVAEKEAAALAALDAYLDAHGSQCAALLAEPLIQGAGGMRMARPGFFRAVADRLRERGVLLILDEVMTGFGRTGKMFACETIGVVPDLVCLSKGLTAGFLPMSVTLCREEIREAFLGTTFDRALAHGHSFTANALGCAVALASLRVFAEEGTLARIAAIEAIHRERLMALSTHPRVLRPRLTGVVAALDLAVADAGYAAAITPRLKAFFLERGLVIRPLGNVIYLLPPYCITPEQLHRGWDGIELALAQVV